MANNLRRLRTAASWTQDEAALALSTTRNQYAKLESGDRRLSNIWIDRAALAFGVDPAEIVRGEIMPAVVGTVVGDGEVLWAEHEPHAGPAVLSLLVDDDALGPLLRSARVQFVHQRLAPAQIQAEEVYLVGIEHAVRIRRVVHAGESRRAFHLIGPRSSPLFDVRLDWVSPVSSISF